MEKFSDIFNFKKEREDKLELALTPRCSEYLKKLMLRPNPTLAEFAYLGLGNGTVVDTIIAVDEELNQRELNSLSPRLNSHQIKPLFVKLMESGRENDLMLFGHSHPIGIKAFEGRYYFVAPNKKLLEPSVWDTEFYKWLFEKVIEIPYAGINTVYGRSHRLRIYKTEDLIKIQKMRQLRLVHQTTFIL